jgi:hypothetical protein
MRVDALACVFENAPSLKTTSTAAHGGDNHHKNSLFPSQVEPLKGAS